MRNRKLFSSGRIFLCMIIVLALMHSVLAQIPGQQPRKRVQPERRAPENPPPPTGQSQTNTLPTIEQSSTAVSSRNRDVAFARFRQKYGAEARIEWDEKTGQPTVVYNFSAPKSVDDDSAAAKLFISDSRELFLKDEDPANLRFLAKRESEGAVHVDFQQFYRDVPVRHAALSVHLIRGRIMMVNGIYIPDLRIDATPTISAEDAVEAAKRDMGTDSLVSSIKSPPELVISTSGDNPVLCWRVTILSTSVLTDWEYLIDARSGAVVEKRDILKRATGSGLVFLENPVVNLSPIFLPFENLDTSGGLRGSFAEVRTFQGYLPDASPFGHSEAISPSLIFNFPRDSRQFSEQMVYYHMNRAHSFFKLLGLNNLDTSLPAFVHYRERGREERPYEKAEFSSARGALFFGDGSGMAGGANNPSYDAAIVAHEYTHAVLFSFRPSLVDSDEDSYAASMNEGFADYFAGTIYNNPIIGQWMSQLTPSKIRRLDNRHRFPEDERNPEGEIQSHFTGLIWSGSLWDVRRVLGPFIADRITFNSIQFLPPQPGLLNFQAGLRALILADTSVRGGVDIPVIQQMLNARGIVDPGGAANPQFTSLTSGVTQTSGIQAAPLGFCLLPAQQFTIDVPPGTSSLSVDATGNGHINLYARRGNPLTIVGGSVVADYRAEFISTSKNILANTASIPALATGTYFIAVSGCSLSPVTFNVRATVVNSGGTGGTDEVRLAPGISFNDVVSASIESGQNEGLLGATQYVVDVPVNATLLNVKLIGTTPGTDIDLLVRSGARVGINPDGLPVADKISGTLTNVESLEFDSSTQPRLALGAKYFIAVSNFSQIPASFQLTATFSTSATTPSEVALQSGIVKSGTVSGVAGFSNISHTNYVLLVPPGASQLRVDLLNNNGTNVDLFIRQGSRVFVNNNFVVGDFASTQNGPAQTIVINRGSGPPLNFDLYYIAVGNRGPTAINFTLLATITQGGGTQFDTPAFHGSVANNVVGAAQAGGIVVDGDQFFIDVPTAVTNLAVRVDADAGKPVILLARTGQRVNPTVVGGFNFFSIVNGTNTITLARPALSPFPALQPGRYYFAVANPLGVFVNYRLTFTMSPAPASATLQFSAATYAAPENAGTARITVIRTGNTVVPVTVNYATNNGTASSRSDYSSARGSLSFAPGETSKSFNVLIADDSLVEGNETVSLGLSNAGGGAVLGTPNTATLTINNNDTVAGAANPIDNTQFLVRQHYADFLGREPDAAGLQFWTNEVAACGSNVQCIQAKRINVSAAFFLSIEYQQTGYLVYRLYKASFNRMPRMEEFQPDTQSIGSGLVVGAPNWEQLLETNKRAFLNTWVTGASFRNAYDDMDNVRYVDTLIANTGTPFPLAQRNALILGLGAGSETRATVLRKVAEDPGFFQREFNLAFVLTQYFGYLKRNPNDAPDIDFSGFNFWLTKLNQFNGNFVQAEMVKAFIASGEYRHRFGLN